MWGGVDGRGISRALSSKAENKANAAQIVYHTLGGVRHLYWEMRPEGLNPTTQYQSSVGLFALSGFLALVAGLM